MIINVYWMTSSKEYSLGLMARDLEQLQVPHSSLPLNLLTWSVVEASQTDAIAEPMVRRLRNCIQYQLSGKTKAQPEANRVFLGLLSVWFNHRRVFTNHLHGDTQIGIKIRILDISQQGLTHSSSLFSKENRK